MLKKFVLLISIIMLLNLAACAPNTSGSTTTGASAEAPNISPIPAPEPSISHTAVSIHPGETLTLSLSGVESINWTSSDPFVVKVDENGVITGRHKSGETIITAEANGKKYTCTVTNIANMRNINASQVVSEMKIGTNFGSALDVIDWDFIHGFDPYPVQIDGLGKLEYYNKRSGNVLTKPDMIDALKEAGYDSVRLTISWSLYADDQTFEIEKAFLDTVEEYVSAVLDNGMYGIINSHYDYLNRSWVGDKWVGDWMMPKYKDYVDARFGAIWKQIAQRFEPYDDHLIFEPMNEPGMDHEAYIAAMGSEKDMEPVQRTRVNELNKIFYDTVRGSGENNAKRILAMSPVRNDVYELQYMKLPDDPNLIAQVHYYYHNDDWSPVLAWNSADPKYRKQIDEAFEAIKEYQKQTKIPVILGEWGNTASLPKAERIDQATYIIKQTREMGIPGFWWECGWLEAEPAEESFAMLDRAKMEWVHPDLLKAIMNSVEN